MARFKYLSATLLALFLSLASCSNNPASPSDPGGTPPEGGGGGNPPATSGDKALFTFSELLTNEQELQSPITIGEFTLTASAGTNNNSPKYYNNGTSLRFYHGNTFTISGTKMTEINFNASYNNSGDLTASAGSYDHDTKVWTGDATSVTFTVGATSGSSGQFRVVAIGVNQSIDDDTGGGEGGGGEPPAPTGEHATFDFSSLYASMEAGTSDEFTSLSGYGLTLSAETGSGSTAPTMFQNGYSLRLYTGNEFTISGSNITRVDFTFDTTKSGTFTANTGTMGDLSWTGSTNELVLTVATGQRRIKSLTVYADIDETDIPETGGDVPGGGESTYTALSVFIDIVAACTGTTMTEAEAKEYADTDIGGYGIAINWGTTSEYTIETALTDALDYYIPEYLVITEEPTADYWDEGKTDPGYFSTLETSDSTVTVELGTFVDGDVYLNITVY